MDYFLCKAVYYCGFFGGIALGLEVARRMEPGLFQVAAAFACIIAGAALAYGAGKIADEIDRDRRRRRRDGTE